jgi:hypothetical protein
MSRNGSQVRQISAGDGTSDSPSWSPGGSRIACPLTSTIIGLPIVRTGRFDLFEAALLRVGARPGGLPEVPDPHVHHYHREWAKAERELLGVFPWNIKPLRPSDVQFEGTESG